MHTCTRGNTTIQSHVDYWTGAHVHTVHTNARKQMNVHTHTHTHAHVHAHPHMHKSVHHVVVAYLSHVEVLIFVWEVRELSRRAVDVHKCWPKCWQKACMIHHNTHSFITNPFHVYTHECNCFTYIKSYHCIYTCHMTTPRSHDHILVTCVSYDHATTHHCTILSRN